ncbi:MAG: LPXTG cell wall anchor domain-containing protein [Rhodocyclales bacterium]|nr:LPXTG cell wall anchor domain-containing protein [Rhodocyclales bacterium]
MRHAVAIVLFTVTFSAFGHGGEDHGAPPPPVAQAIDPRAAAATEEFEVVTSLEGKKLVVYVDRFASNEPVAQAKVEIEGAGLKGVASEMAPGTYVLDVAPSLPPAKHPLTISIEAGDTVDLLSATLDTSASVANVAHSHGWSEWIVWVLAGALLLLTGILFAARRRKRAKKGI